LALHLFEESSAERLQRSQKLGNEETSAAAGLSGQQLWLAPPEELIQLESLCVVCMCVETQALGG